MDALFLIGQVVWIAVLACGAYVSFSYYELADAEQARKAPLQPPQQPARDRAPAALSLQAR